MGTGGCGPSSRAGGVRASLELVRALMRVLDLRPCQPRPWRPVTTVAGDAGAVPDLVRRDFTAPAPGLKFVVSPIMKFPRFEVVAIT